MTKVYKIHITGGESESPRSQTNPLPPEKGCGRKKQGTKEKDEGDTHKPDSQVSSCGGKQAEKSFSKKLKNVKEYFKGMKLFERCRRATSSITPRDMKEHMQKLGHHLKAGSDVDYTLLEEPEFHYWGGCRELLLLYKHIRGTEFSP
ncbi:hypothetical protein PGIGA_G00127170 [Pangasianodon gigas]|uniref:Uncharacterized protein n=1 Tax=Pangasianodon gigas TaxID=30993 RepID=A0ACC5XHS2_PANGG|nr:hypothetical protein [Pangasianodon gigas]